MIKIINYPLLLWKKKNCFENLRVNERLIGFGVYAKCPCPFLDSGKNSRKVPESRQLAFFGNCLVFPALDIGFLFLFNHL